MRRPAGQSRCTFNRLWKPQLPGRSLYTPTFAKSALAALLLLLPAGTLLADGVEPNYWRTRIFLIPYQPPTPSGLLSNVEKVQLLVSREGESQWAVLQEADPRVRGFTYHAPVDGLYSFAVRTIDRKGEASPAVISQPQLQVVVDTTPPTLALRATPDATGRIIVQYEGRDLKLKPETVRLEVQTDGATWQRIATGPPDVSQPDRVVGQVAWKPPTSAAGVKFRGTIDDRAGNQFSTVADASLVGPLLSPGAGPTLAMEPTLADEPTLAAGPSLGAAAGGPSLFAQGNPATSIPQPASPLEWPREQPAAPSANAATPSTNAYSSATQPPPPLWPEDRTRARLVADNGAAPTPYPTSPFQSNSTGSNNNPFSAPPLVGASSTLPSSPPPLHGAPSLTPMTPPAAGSWTTAASEPQVDAAGARWVNSLTFDVDYDLQTVGPWGVSKVELFATRDGGASWVNFGADPDNRSPMRVAVPAAGVYGFRLVVNGANGAPAPTPTAGQQPELVIGVDLAEPQAELGPAEIGQGNLADHLIIRWTASDENLDARPVGLFYANSPEGPWSTVATDIDNNGQYAWRLLQQVPERLFLRLEVRDKAGNVTVRQSQAPVALNLPQPTGTLRSVRPVQGEPQRFRTATGQAVRNQ